MSTEEKPLPDFAQIPTPLPSRRSKANGIPRAPVAAPSSAFSIIETDEVSRTLDFGMSEEDLEDVSDGEGSSSDLHDSLRALHETADSTEDSFETLSSDYSSGVREEDTYLHLETDSEVAPDFELPPLEAASIPAPEMKRPRNARPAAALQRPRNTQSLPDFSKFDEVEEVAKPIVEEEVVEAKSKISPKLLMMIVAVVVVVVIAAVVVLFVLPGISSPAVIAPVVAQFGHLLQ